MLAGRLRPLTTFCLITRRSFQAQASPSIQPNVDYSFPVFKNAPNHSAKLALRDSLGSYTYGNLFLTAKELAGDISRRLDGKTGERVLFMCSNDANYVISLWAIWMSGQVAVPLSPLHPQNFLLYYTNDTKGQLILTAPEYKEVTQRVAKNSNLKLLVLDDKMRLNCSQKEHQRDCDLEVPLPQSFYNRSNALILYTSGTTGNPKGVVLTHKNLNSQINCLLDAWHWSTNDVILHALPLHHVHGLVNALLCPLQIGAKTVMLPKFDANLVWSHLLAVNAKPGDRKITVYMGVPTMYSRLIDEFTRILAKDAKMVDYIKNNLKTRLRLMVCGSAPLPDPIFNKWFEISGHCLLERYGMTEIGMCLSNLYDAEREPGYVGLPLPGVTVRIGQRDLEGDYITLLECANENGRIKIRKDDNAISDEMPTGHLLVKSEGVFKEYFNRPDATHDEFTIDNFFKTGDLCQYDISKKKFKILGRESIDIIKSGGYKLSALQIETQLLCNPDIKECSIVGIPDKEFGQKVAALVVLNADKEMTLTSLREWGQSKLPKYSLPSVLKLVRGIPKNAMGKVNKKDLIKIYFSDTQ